LENGITKRNEVGIFLEQNIIEMACENHMYNPVNETNIVLGQREACVMRMKKLGGFV